MNCPKCNSNNVIINMQEIGSKTQKKSNSIGHKMVHSTMRKTTGLFTFGISNLFIPKKLEGKEKTKNKLVKIAVCQNCGYDWKILF